MIRFVDNSIICRGLLRRFGLVYLLLITFVSFTLCCPHTASAQPSSKTSDQPDKAAVQNLLDELDDIDVGRYVTPLNLTAEQIEKIIAAISDSNSQFDKKILDLRAAGVNKMADEINKRHKETLAGAPASKEFDDKVRAMLADFYAKKQNVYNDALAALSLDCGKILTAEQKKIAAQMEKDMFAKLGKKMNPSNTDDQYFTQYVLDVFIKYHRIVPLLKAIKPA